MDLQAYIELFYMIYGHIDSKIRNDIIRLSIDIDQSLQFAQTAEYKKHKGR